jgi:bifunctional UDP-N-acetylglucosamine pyrophosphorylase/glucosamine-1-phosphate N-acetyltransferase
MIENNRPGAIRALALAAGRSKRMQSEKSKVLHKLLGKPVIEFVADALAAVDSFERIGIVVSEQNRDEIKSVLGNRVDYILQTDPRGTGHAVMAATDWLSGFDGNLVVVVGDAPLLTPEMIRQLIEKQQSADYAAVFLSSIYDEPPPYGRVVRDAHGKVIRIVEEKDADEAEKRIREVSSSHYCFDMPRLLEALSLTTCQNAQKEYYLPDVIGIFIRQGYAVEALPVRDPALTFGINNRKDMVYAIAELRRRITEKWLDSGVTIIDPASTYIDATVQIGKDVIIHPFSYLAEHTQIGDGCEIGPFVKIIHSSVSANAKIESAGIINNEYKEGV